MLVQFRTWCREKWFEHREELYNWEGFYPTATPQEYFNKYKYWLKREYQAQRNNNESTKTSSGNFAD